MSSQAHEAEPRILFVHYDLNQPVGVELWRGIKQTASGFAHPPDLKLEGPRNLAMPRSDLLAGQVVPVNDETLARELAARPIPVFVVSHTLDPIPGLLYFINDELAVGRMAAAHLWEAGFRHFRGIGYEGKTYSDERLQGFEMEILRRGGTVRTGPPPAAPLKGPWRRTAYVDALAKAFADELINSPPDTGFFCANDWLAGLFLEILEKHYPERLHTSGVIGVDNGGDPRYNWVDARPDLSSVIPGFYEIGREIVRWMMRYGRKADVPREGLVRRFAPVGTVARASTAGYACAHPVAGRAGRWIWDQVQRGESVQVKDVAAHLKLSPRSLERLFAAHYPCGVKDMILRMRMDLAKQLLRSTEQSIAEISFRCGFSSQSVFGRVFHEREGATPRDWRKQALS